MSTEITKEEWAETNRKASEIIKEFQIEALKELPLWMRMNYFLNKMANALEKGYKDEDFKWDYINELCVANLNPFDYNMYKPVETIREFESQRFDVICASEGIGRWHKHKCKDCGKEFYMYFKEVQFFKRKELNLPKRCKACRDKRKNNSAK